MSETRYQRTIVIPSDFSGRRIDQVLASLCDDVSRTLIHTWIIDRAIKVDGRLVKPNFRVRGEETVQIDGDLPPALEWDKQEDIEFQVLFHDEHLIVVDKPAGLVVHPGTGNPSGTLVNGLLARFPSVANLHRAGIVHRIDKDTTGLLVVAHSELAQRRLSGDIQSKAMVREYYAIVEGLVHLPQMVELPIGRHNRDRTKQAISESGRPAKTEFTPLETYRRHTLLKAKLHTGRTHQIRVHSSAIGHPVLGDRSYGAQGLLPKHPTQHTIDVIRGFNRQALHARRMELTHPVSEKRMAFVSAIPTDMQTVLSVLRADLETA